MTRTLRLIALSATALGAVLLRPSRLAGQGVLIAPHVVYIDHRTRSGSLTLYNPGPDPVEISIETVFGYPVTDSAGAFSLRIVDHPDSTLPSAAAWLQAYPRRLLLPPQERQTVRLLGRPPAKLADGEYWARLVVTAKGGQIPVSGVADSGQIRIGLTLEVRTILPVLYRKGPVGTGVSLSRLEAGVRGDSLEVWAHLVRQGNAAFIGTVRGVLVDSTGKAVTRFAVPEAVYYDLQPRFTAPLVGVAPGRYRLRIEVTSERDDIPAEAILPIPPLRDSIEVALP
jgi:hypothetical protein